MTDKSSHNDKRTIESLEPIILMSASAADIDPATLGEGTDGNDVLIALNADQALDGKDGHDIVIGLAGDNLMKGGDGHDMIFAVRGDNVIDGGSGQDTLVYWQGNRSDYTVTDKGFGIYEFRNDHCTDFVRNIEEVQFKDGTYTIDELISGSTGGPDSGGSGGSDGSGNPGAGGSGSSDTGNSGDSGGSDDGNSSGSGDSGDPPTGSNQNPVAGKDYFSVNQNETLYGNVSVNDSDPDGPQHELTYELKSQPDHGTVSLYGDGSFDYQPANGFSGQVKFQYTVRDQDGSMAMQEVCIDVQPGSTPPPAGKGSIGDMVWLDANRNGVMDNGEQGVADVDVQLKDGSGTVIATQQTNADGKYLFSGLTAGQYSIGIVTPDGRELTTMDANGNGSDAIDSDVNPATGMTNTIFLNNGEQNLTLDAGLVSTPPPNDAPDAMDDSAVVICGEHSVTVDVLANDTDPNGDSLSTMLMSGPQNGSVTANSDGSFTYTADNGFAGQDSFVYKVDDGNGGTDTATVYVSVEAPKQINATIVGDMSVTEGNAGTYKIQLDEAVTETTVFNVRVSDGTARRIDRNDYEVANQDIMWGGYYDIRSGIGGPIVKIVEDRIANGTAVSTGNRPTVGPDGAPIWDYTVLQNGRVNSGEFLQVVVEAGETMSDTFQVQTWKEKVTVDRDSDFTRRNPDYVEGNENFSIAISSVGSHSDCDIISTGSGKDVVIRDMGDYRHFSPIALDLNGDGKIGVTGDTSSVDKDATAAIGRTVEFDIDADGRLDTIEWFAGDGDGILIDNRDGNAENDMDGSRLFGDQGGKYANGYEKLALLDTNADGMLTGSELSGLELWLDDGDARVEQGELHSLEAHNVVGISTQMELVQDAEGRNLMQSAAVLADGTELLTEDVWFAGK